MKPEELTNRGFARDYQEGEYLFYKHPDLHFHVGLKISTGRFLLMEYNREYFLGKVPAKPERLDYLLNAFAP